MPRFNQEWTGAQSLLQACRPDTHRFARNLNPARHHGAGPDAVECVQEAGSVLTVNTDGLRPPAPCDRKLAARSIHRAADNAFFDRKGRIGCNNAIPQVNREYPISDERVIIGSRIRGEESERGHK